MADNKQTDQNEMNKNPEQQREQGQSGQFKDDKNREQGQSGQFKDEKSGEKSGEKSAIGGGQSGQQPGGMGGQSGQQPGQSDRSRESEGSSGGSDKR